MELHSVPDGILMAKFAALTITDGLGPDTQTCMRDIYRDNQRSGWEIRVGHHATRLRDGYKHKH